MRCWVLVTFVLLACTPRARSALVPRLRVRAVAQRHQAEDRFRWEHAVRLTATFVPSPRRARPIDEPAGPIVFGPLPGAVDCQSRVLCAWELRRRHRTLEALSPRMDP